MLSDAAVQVAAPSLALFFAALGSTPTPRGGRVCGPSISSPDRSFVLTSDNCPPSFANAFALWQSTVGPIQELASDGDQRHDLALVLCDHEPVSNRIDLGVAKLASELKAIGLEILQVRRLASKKGCRGALKPGAFHERPPQRRTFQLRFQTDLNVALGSAVRPRSPHIDATKTATFEPPPMYSEGRPTSDTKRAYSSIEDEERRYLAAGRGAGMRTTNVVESTVTGEQESNLSVIRETLYSGELVPFFSRSPLDSLCSQFGRDRASRLSVLPQRSRTRSSTRLRYLDNWREGSPPRRSSHRLVWRSSKSRSRESNRTESGSFRWVEGSQKWSE